MLLLLVPAIKSVAVGSEQQQLYVGWASADITPQGPVAIPGNRAKAISKGVNDPLMATVLALETVGRDGQKEQAIMVSCDVLWIRKAIQDRVQKAVFGKLKGFDVEKSFLNATHTHRGPCLIKGAFFGLYDVSKDEGVIKPDEYADFFVQRVAEAVVKAWKNRKPGGMSWGLGEAVLGWNRRVKYFDGHVDMHGKVNKSDFSHIEGYEDHGVSMLFFWDQQRKLTGIIFNMACTAQVGRKGGMISADFWYETRQSIWSKYGKDVFVFAQCGAAGDQVPVNHNRINKKARETMLERKGISWNQEFADRLVRVVDEVLPFAKKDIKNAVIFKHTIAQVNLATKQPPAQPFYTTDSVQPATIHVIRLGDIVMASNPFELFVDYGLRIRGRSKALLTFIVQLSGSHSGYLPTQRAIEGGGYSAEKYIVGPEGGQMLVNETVKLINEMWE